MHKRGRNLRIKGAALSEIFVLIIATFAFAFVLGEANMASGQTGDVSYYLWRTGPGRSPSEQQTGTLSSNQVEAGTVFRVDSTAGSLHISSDYGKTWIESTGGDKPQFMNYIGGSDLIKATEIAAYDAGFDKFHNTQAQAGGVPITTAPAGASGAAPGEGTQPPVKSDYQNAYDTYLAAHPEDFGGASRAAVMATAGLKGADKVWSEAYSNALTAKYDASAAIDIANKAELEYLAKAAGEKLPGATDFSWSELAGGLTFAAGMYTLAKGMIPAFGYTEKQTNVLANAIFFGVMAGKTASMFSATQEYAGTIGWSVALLWIVIGFKNVKERTVTFTCMPWEAPTGGTNCERCNGDAFRPCTEYRCMALGAACELLNKDKPGRELCAQVSRGDASSATITPWVGALYPVDLSYISDTSVRPPALGVRIVSAGGGCLKAYTPLKFGISTNKPTMCKIDTNLNNTKFDNMQFYMGGDDAYAYNHTETMRLPSPAGLGENAGILLQNGDTMQMFVRCKDRNGNENVDAYSVKFCVDKSPDTTPPWPEGTSIPSGNPVGFGMSSVPVDVYINEPAECRWSVESKGYDLMENVMDCSMDPRVINSMPTYVCAGNFTGIKNMQDNKFYIRCKDQPEAEDSKRNVMVQSYELVLKGTQQLNIVRVAPNESVTGSTSAVDVNLEVETDDGAEEGKATCFFSPFTNDSFTQMFETGSFQHKQTLQLVAGVYTYFYRCVDLGGNTVDSKTTFAVYSDTSAPKVSRVYKEEGTGLKVVTNEDAECRYSLNDCNFVFAEGLSLVYSNPNIKTNSYAEWKPNTIYYIKCMDMYGNEPNPNECSVIAKPIENTVIKL